MYWWQLLGSLWWQLAPNSSEGIDCDALGYRRQEPMRRIEIKFTLDSPPAPLAPGERELLDGSRLRVADYLNNPGAPPISTPESRKRLAEDFALRGLLPLPRACIVCGLVRGCDCADLGP